MTWDLEKHAAQRRARSSRVYVEFRAWLDELKLERGCMDCGYRQHPAALDFDHRDPTTKRFVIASGASRRREIVLEEIAKCDVVCSNCHRVRTAERGGLVGRRRKEPWQRRVKQEGSKPQFVWEIGVGGTGRLTWQIVPKPPLTARMALAPASEAVQFT